MPSGVRVVRNELPRIIRELPEAVDDAVDETATSIADLVKATGWADRGVVLSTTTARVEGRPMHAEVRVGVKRGRGFYASFLEFGTSKMRARPVVQPAAHSHEPILTLNVATAVRRVVG